jgi:hypothetical protein
MCSSACHVIMIIAYHRIWCIVCIFTYTIASYRIGGVASSSSGEADQVRSIRNPGTGGAIDRQAIRGSTWVCGPPIQSLRMKPRSLLSLLLYKSNSFYIWFYIIALSYRSWLKPLMHLLLSFPMLLHSYPVRLGSNNCLALLRPVVIGDSRSPTFIGGYWNDLAIDEWYPRNNHVLMDNWRPNGEVRGNQTGF